MSASLNKVILIGNLTRYPESVSFSNGDSVTNFSIATSETWKDKQTGEKKEATEFHKIVCYRGLAAVAADYLEKGSSVYIEGKLKTRKWQDKDGNDKYSVEIVCDELKMLGKPKGSKKESVDEQAKTQGAAAKKQSTQVYDAIDDDIPF